MTDNQTAPAVAGQAAALPQETITPPAAGVPQAAPPKPAATSGVSTFLFDLVFMIIISAMVSIAVTMYLPKWLGMGGEKASLQDTIVTVNFEAIVRDQISALSDKVRVGDIEPKDMPKHSEQFMSALLAKIKAQTEEGKIVLRSEQVLGAPDSIPDLTDRFRAELQREGFMERKLEKGDDPTEARKDAQ